MTRFPFFLVLGALGAVACTGGIAAPDGETEEESDAADGGLDDGEDGGQIGDDGAPAADDGGPVEADHLVVAEAHS
ncbi:MAG TPA: hypothetical protein P5076_22445, partial [Myxococcota bacterium]|nr:hypothetical protein [Myxococcota bacterium]